MSKTEETLPEGSRFGNYDIVRVLGEGAFGAVYEALRQPLGKRVALKVLHRKLVTQQEVLQRFLREAQTTATVQHPNICETFDIGEHEGAPYLAMEYLEGEPLFKRIKRDRAMPTEMAIDLMLPVLSAMVTVHDRGIIHRDLKPENIFLVKGRHGAVRPKVLDFGIAKVTQADTEMSLTRTTTLLGTPYYMSPEQARESKHIDARSDQWALGVILYECLTGRRPFAGTSLLELLSRITASEYPPLSQVVEGVPPQVEAAVGRMLRRDPAERFPDEREVARALLPFASAAARALWADEFSGPSVQPPPEAPSEPPMAMATTYALSAPPMPAAGGTLTLSPRESATPAQPSNAPKRNRALAAAGVAAAVLVAAGGTWLATRSGAASSPTAQVAVAPGPTARANFRVITRVTPATATLSLDDEDVAVGALDRELPADGAAHRLVASAPGYRTTEIQFRDHFTAGDIALTREEPPAPVAAPPVPTPVAAPVAAEAAPAVRAGRAGGRRPRGEAATPHGDHATAPAHSEQPETGSNGVAIR